MSLSTDVNNIYFSTELFPNKCQWEWNLNRGTLTVITTYFTLKARLKGGQPTFYFLAISAYLDLDHPRKLVRLKFPPPENPLLSLCSSTTLAGSFPTIWMQVLSFFSGVTTWSRLRSEQRCSPVCKPTQKGPSVSPIWDHLVPESIVKKLSTLKSNWN